MVYLFLPIIVIVAVGLAWTWWEGRVDRDPASSVDHFHRALAAMEPVRASDDADADRQRVDA
ncbi:MAG: hypothetical protein KY469_16360 [Actinobacteria bacterium]|nr:hypothetical protein [Actinomycetota bacterium]